MTRLCPSRFVFLWRSFFDQRGLGVYQMFVKTSRNPAKLLLIAASV